MEVLVGILSPIKVVLAGLDLVKQNSLAGGAVLNLDVSQEDAPFRRHEARIVVVIAPPIRVDLNGGQLLISHLE